MHRSELADRRGSVVGTSPWAAKEDSSGSAFAVRVTGQHLPGRRHITHRNGPSTKLIGCRFSGSSVIKRALTDRPIAARDRGIRPSGRRPTTILLAPDTRC